MNDKQQEQNFPSSSIIKDVDNKFHQLLKETVHDFLFQPLEKKTCTNPIISNLLMHEVKVSTSQQQPRTSGFFDSRKRNIVEKTNDIKKNKKNIIRIEHVKQPTKPKFSPLRKRQNRIQTVKVFRGTGYQKENEENIVTTTTATNSYNRKAFTNASRHQRMISQQYRRDNDDNNNISSNDHINKYIELSKLNVIYIVY